ncbi:MAG: hypothetical protein GKS05_09060 [Nitrospirales bacterium]|nr:hypothetical protein [Nitrospirales bacterium]
MNNPVGAFYDKLAPGIAYGKEEGGASFTRRNANEVAAYVKGKEFNLDNIDKETFVTDVTELIEARLE